MGIKLKRISEQTIVITGATSGIGLTTARMAAGKGARLVLAARNEEALKKLTDEINSSGSGEAVYVAADVGKEGDVVKIASEAIARFGNFDTWINNAGVSIYGKIEEISSEDHRRLFETNFWGVVYGSTVAARHLKIYGGALINVGSTLSDRAVPIQGMYSASKHAVKGFTDALRMELEAEDAPVSVTLIKPGAIDTPYKDHAKNYLDEKPSLPPPVYAPEVVAETILHCAENPTRDAFVGGGGKAIAALGRYAPRVSDKFMEASMEQMQASDNPENRPQREGLYESTDSDLNQSGGYAGHVMKSSLYTKASLHPYITGAALLALGAGVGLLASRASDKEH